MLALDSLPTPHKDPFDRLLITQANNEGAVLLSREPIFAQYPVQHIVVKWPFLIIKRVD